MKIQRRGSGNSNGSKWTVKQALTFETQAFAALDLHLLEPMGISLGADSMRPVLLLKSTLNSQILPVSLNPLEAGVTLGQSTQTESPVHTHRVLQDLLKALGWSIQKAVFCEIKGPHQKIRMHFQKSAAGAPNGESEQELVFRADEAMSVCLHLNVPLYAPVAFIQASRELTSDLTDLALGISTRSGLLSRKHIYMQ